MDTIELPVYAAVKHALGIKFSQQHIRKYNGRKLNDRQMDLKEYIRQYIQWNYPHSYI